MDKSLWPDWLPLRDDLVELKPYGAPQIGDVIALNTNENPYQLPLEVQRAILKEIESVLANLNRYPDRDAISLREKLAEYINQLHGTSHSFKNIWVANGRNEILQTIALAFGGAGRKAIGFTPSYSMHPLIARITGTQWISFNRANDFALDLSAALSQIKEAKPSLIFITTPNNPSGSATPHSHIKDLAHAAKESKAILVVDEAYEEFSPEESAVTLIEEIPQLVVSRTMSKAFAFAGARVGYLVANPNVVNALSLTRLPYHLSALTQAAAAVAIDHAPLLQSGLKSLISERTRVSEALGELGWVCETSHANFLLFSEFPGEPADIWQMFLDKGVLIRDIGLRIGEKKYLRVTIGTPEENDTFLQAAREIATGS